MKSLQSLQTHTFFLNFSICVKESYQRHFEIDRDALRVMLRWHCLGTTKSIRTATI